MNAQRLAMIAITCLLSTVVWASPIITVGTIEAQAGTTKTFSISVTGGDAVQGLDLFIQIGDGGAINGGVATKPVITNVDIIGAGTMFHASNTGQTNAATFGQLWAVSTTTNTSNAGYLNASGIIAYVTINTAGTAVGQSYPLYLSGVAAGIFGAPGIDTSFAGLSATITNGQINIIPEPPPAFLAGDADKNNKIDGADLLILNMHWDPLGVNANTWLDGDFDDNGKVDGADLLQLNMNWAPLGYTMPSDLTNPVPEPITMTLLAVGSLGLLPRRNRK